MNTSVPVVSRESEFIDPNDRELIIGTMRRWLDGEPVWSHAEILQRWGREFLMYRTAWANNEDPLRGNFERGIGMYGLRNEAIANFGFCLPCSELLDVLEKHQPIVEIGAGTGYMTALMRKRGIDVIGSDPGPGHGQFTLAAHDPEQLKLPGKTAVRRYRDRTVFCSWPSLNHTWFRQALRAMRIGQRAIIIEEDACSEESTWDYRDASFDPDGDWIELPAWPNLNDRARVWVKKRHTVMRVKTLEEAEAEREANWAVWRRKANELEDSTGVR